MKPILFCILVYFLLCLAVYFGPQIDVFMRSHWEVALSVVMIVGLRVSIWCFMKANPELRVTLRWFKRKKWYTVTKDDKTIRVLATSHEEAFKKAKL